MTTKDLFQFKEKQGVVADKKEHNKTCKTCVHRQRWECESKVFQYCAVRKSNRTFNGLKKIKCKDKTCEMYKEIEL